ncbi:NADH-quinone oxidoreductase subunit L [Dehalogenimonas formicexedens]|uniref:NADH-quinone oxidoreductase subunit L n=1 Tax=Dehalogenimonas formicexedens TaxID=1839801 RepID=A0A1P8F6J7_9CHLR|nr:NADH-quinone oxidoreductase subunit L [Dehalogenimonas formicexedens]APV44099.1 NADH-quinone oxidoreductase subunit L [Dehalogenimonas formicexedens]
MITPFFIWAIFGLPLLAFALIALIVKPFLKTRPEVSGYIGILAAGICLALSAWALAGVIQSPHHEITMSPLNWLSIGSLQIQPGIILDSLTAVMLVVITAVALMVNIYSMGYMAEDPGFERYFAVLSLFSASMIGLVLSDNLFVTFMFWELVGLCSYLLIGFWFQRPAAAAAAKKAFIVTRIGDFGFLAAILVLFANAGTLDIRELNNLAIAGVLAGGIITWAALGIFLGAMGKSAQFPLHVWLPDAMEGPTPVSALIHAATMVAAGVFLVARTYPLFEHSATALMTVAVIGGITAIFAASMGLVMHDMKRVLAYSTISQLGYMMLGLGTGGIAIAMFHLMNHAFFKSLLFLGSGSVNHSTGTFDLRQMGGLKSKLPKTYWTMVVASLSMAGIWPLSGFFSKDEIVAGSSTQPILMIFALVTVFLTAFYMFRLIFLAFHGTYRGQGHPHKPPAVMTTPLIILAVPAAFSGFINLTGGFDGLFGHGETYSPLEGLFGVFKEPVTWISLLLAVSGIFLAYSIYLKGWLSAENISRRFGALYELVRRKYFFDELYEKIIGELLLLRGVFTGFQYFDSRLLDNGLNTIIVENVITRSLFGRFKYFDEKAVDGAVDAVADNTIAAGSRLRRLQTGRLQTYGLFIAFGIMAIVVVVFLAG